MPNPQIYTEALQLFKNTYKLEKYDLKELQKSNLKFIYLNSAFNQSTTGDSPAAQFTGLVGKTLAIYLETQTNLREDGKYLSSFNAKQFLADFEKLADAKYRSELEESQEYNRKKYAGANIEDLNRAFGKQINEINKPLPTLWMEQLKEGSMEMDQLHALTKRHYDSMDKTWNKSEITMAGSLTNVIAGYEAMKQLRESRKGFFGWLWKLFNGEQNRQEEAYFNELSNQVEKLGIHFNVKKISATLTGKTVFGKDVKVKEKAKESLEQSKIEAVKVEPVAESINYKFQHLNLKKEFANQLLHQLPENGKADMVNETFINLMVSAYFLDGVKEVNQKFDEGLAMGNDPKMEMKNVVKGIFQCAVNAAKGYDNRSSEHELNVIRVMTKVATKMLTAASLYPEELGEIVDGYIEETITEYKEKGAVGKEVKQDNSQEKVFNENNPFPENNVNKSAQIVEQPQIKAISLDKR